MALSLSQIKRWLLYAFILIAYMSPNLWSSIPIFNSQVERIVQFFILLLELTYITKLGLWKKYSVIVWFSIWAFIGVIRGIYVADCYWEYNQLTIGTMCLSLPLLVYVFDDPKYALKVNNAWVRWCVLPFFVFFFWTCGPTQFYLAPMFFFACFFFEIPKKWRFIIGVCLLLMALQFGARAQVMKVAIGVCFALAYQFRRLVPNVYMHLLHWFFYVIAVLLLYLGISGQYNFFKDGVSGGGDRTGKYEYTNKDTGKSEDLASDTRTFIYQEVITSAVAHEYVLFGRTPAMGNDSSFFDDINKNYSKPTRFMNEVCQPNIFTWLGLVGVILYSLIYLRASWLAMYRSRSFALKVIGCLIAFHWAMGWMEDTNLFNISNISLWMIIAMGFSEKFRGMSDGEFVLWFKQIFKKVRL